MPQASDELREVMNRMFGDPTSEEGPVRYLTQAGYSLRRGWTWKPKDGVTGYDGMTQEEYDCLLFLAHEWDYGGLSTEARPG